MDQTRARIARKTLVALALSFAHLSPAKQANAQLLDDDFFDPDAPSTALSVELVNLRNKGDRVPAATALAMAERSDLLSLTRQHQRSLQSLRARVAPNIDSLSLAATVLLDSVAAIDCRVAADAKRAEQLESSIGRLSRRIYRSYLGSREDDPWQRFGARIPPGVAGTSELGIARCTLFRNRVVENRGELLGFLPKLGSIVAREVNANKARADSMAELIELAEGRIVALDKALNEREGSRTRLADGLWKIILVIGVLSLGAIALTRFFPVYIQFEWVASGQVIQFVTVMIILSAIMSLGLTDVLKENTLGTLLGGIGGYILSQGVGRAAAREAMRSSREGEAAGAGRDRPPAEFPTPATGERARRPTESEGLGPRYDRRSRDRKPKESPDGASAENGTGSSPARS